MPSRKQIAVGGIAAGLAVAGVAYVLTRRKEGEDGEEPIEGGESPGGQVSISGEVLQQSLGMSGNLYQAFIPVRFSGEVSVTKGLPSPTITVELVEPTFPIESVYGSVFLGPGEKGQAVPWSLEADLFLGSHTIYARAILENVFGRKVIKSSGLPVDFQAPAGSVTITA